MYDLIYFDEKRELYYEYEEKLKNEFPNCVVEDASDEVHLYRLSISNVSDEDAYYKYLIKEKILLHSLGAQLKFRIKKDELWKEKVKGWLKECNVAPADSAAEGE